MKMIIAIIRPDKFEAVQAALDAKEIYLMTASDVRGCGVQRGYTESFRGGKGFIRLLSKVKLEIAVNDDFVEPAVAGHPQGCPFGARTDRRRKDLRPAAGGMLPHPHRRRRRRRHRAVMPQAR